MTTNERRFLKKLIDKAFPGLKEKFSYKISTEDAAKRVADAFKTIRREDKVAILVVRK